MNINTKIPKLRRFVLQNFPFIEADFDALTDYALICKVVEYLNHVIQQTNNLTDATVGLIDAFNELKGFVEHYFDNLDVQEEINNKLDAMTEDGTLQNILSECVPQRFLDNYSPYCQTVTVDGVDYTDWTPAIEEALDNFSGAIFFNKGIYYISDTIVLNRVVSLIGNGQNSTIIKLIPDSTVTGDSLIKLTSNYCEVRNLKVEGSSTTYGFSPDDTAIKAGILLANGSGHSLVDNVFIGRINGSGLKTEFTSYDVKIQNVTVNYCADYGIWVDATDVFLNNCVCFRIDKHGFYVTHGNNLLEQCKAYYTGMINLTTPTTTGCGFYETPYSGSSVHTNRYVNCESQEAGWHGFYSSTADGDQFIGCQSDTNGVFVDDSAGFYLTNATYCTIDGVVVNKEYLGGANFDGLNKIGIYLNGSNNDVNLKIYTELKSSGGTSINTKFYDKMYDISDSISNKVVINGFDVNKPLYENEMYMEGENTGVADDFEFQKVGASLVGSASIDYSELAQKISVTDSSGATVGNNVKIKKRVNVPTGLTKFSLWCERKEDSKTDGCPLRFRVRCYNSGDTQLTSVDYSATQSNFIGNADSKTAWNIFNKEWDIANNTAYIVIEILLNINSVGAINSAYIKNLKYKLY